MIIPTNKFSKQQTFCVNLITHLAIYMAFEKDDKTFNDAELELLKEGLKRTYKERFEMATRLYKIQQTMNKATIVHKPMIEK